MSKWLITGNINSKNKSMVYTSEYYKLTENDIKILLKIYDYIIYVKRLHDDTTIW